jgi:hypothetical protein
MQNRAGLEEKREGRSEISHRHRHEQMQLRPAARGGRRRASSCRREKKLSQELQTPLPCQSFPSVFSILTWKKKKQKEPSYCSFSPRSKLPNSKDAKKSKMPRKRKGVEKKVEKRSKGRRREVETG